MDYKHLSFAGAHRLVERLKSSNVDVRWDGWDIVFWRPSPRGFTSKFGAFRNSQWGVENRFAIQQNGTWKVPAYLCRTS